MLLFYNFGLNTGIKQTLSRKLLETISGSVNQKCCCEDRITKKMLTCQTGQLFKDPTHLEAPECAVRRVVLAAAAHLKGQGDGVPLHLEHLLGPARAQHRLAPEPVQVAPIFHHLGE